MKLFKQLAAILTAAVISAGAATAAYAESPTNSGTPIGADLLVTGENDPTSPPGTSPDGTASQPAENDPPAVQIPESGSPAVIGPSDKTFTPIDLKGWRAWDGTTELNENTNYYIYETASLSGEFTIPAGSKLLVGENTKLMIFSSSTLSVSGSLIVAPGGEILSSGTFSLLENGAFENYGNVKFTANSTVNVSSDFVTYGGSETAMGGKTFVYGKGNFINHGTAYVPRFSEATVTGGWRSSQNGLMYIDGRFTTTLNGTLNLAGYAHIQEHARIINSGMLVIETTVKYYVDQDAAVTNTKSGRIIDYRDPDVTPPPAEFEEGIKGIDVSVWQGFINWKLVKESGVQFAIIRSSSGSRVDKMFDFNITQASKAGILVGVYHYCYALNPEEAREEARHFIETIKPYRIDYPVMFDFEDNTQANLGKEMLTDIAEAFLSEVKNAGYYPMIYSYRNWLENNLDMDRLSEYEVALAEWNVTEPKYTRPYGIWQYSCKGKVSGIEGDVDLDICYKDYAKIIREGGYNKVPSEK